MPERVAGVACDDEEAQAAFGSPLETRAFEVDQYDRSETPKWGIVG
jgi:hypothetical protein